MLQNTRVKAFPVSELLRENQQGVKLLPTPPPKNTHTQIRVKRLTLTVCWKVVSPVVGTTHKGLWWLQRRFDSNIYVKTTKTWFNLITLIWKLKAEEEKYKYQNIASASFHLKLNLTGKSLDCKTCYTRFFMDFLENLLLTHFSLVLRFM